MNTQTTVRWFPMRNYFRPPWKLLSFVCVFVAIGGPAFFGINPFTVASTILFILLMLFFIQESEKKTSVDIINEELERFGVVQSVEGQPILNFDGDGNLLSVILSGIDYNHIISHSHIGHQVYLTHIETEPGWLIIVTEGDHNAKHRHSVAFRSANQSAS